jgi:RNA polymerase sigma-70 factor, ECF subfamily
MDPQARFDALYREHAGAVTRYVRRRCTAESVEDAVADVFVVAWRRLDEMPDDPLPWLLGVARRTLSNHRRGDARADALRHRLRAEQSAGGGALHAGEPQPEAVWEALGRLSERDREVLLLVAWEGLSTARAAAVLGIGANACAARLYRARRRLGRALGIPDRRDGRRERPSADSGALR